MPGDELNALGPRPPLCIKVVLSRNDGDLLHRHGSHGEYQKVLSQTSVKSLAGHRSFLELASFQR